MADVAHASFHKQAAAGAAVGGLTSLWLWLAGPDWRAAAVLALVAAGATAALWTLARRERWVFAFVALTLLAPPLGEWGFHPAMAVAALGLFGLRRLRPGGLGAAGLWLLTMLLLSLGPALALSGWRVAAASGLRCGLFGIALLAFWSVREGFPARRWLRWLAVATALTGLLACLDFLFQWPPLAPHSEQYVWMGGERLRRAQGFFYDAGQLGNYCVFGLLGAVLLLARPAAREALGLSWKAVALGTLPLAAALVFSYSRASALALAVGLLAVVSVRSIWKTLAVAGGSALAALVACLALAPRFTSSYLERFVETLELAATHPALALGDRWDSWALLAGFLAERPATLLLGVGYKTLPHSAVAGRPVIADNMYLSLLVEAGLGGLLAVLALLAAALWIGRRGCRSADPLTSFLGAWTLTFWAALAVQMAWVDLLTYWRVLPIYFVIAALLERRLSEEAPCGS